MKLLFDLPKVKYAKRKAKHNSQSISKLFQERIAGYVDELTDDKSLLKQRRKELQVENAYRKPPETALVKLADKSSNVGALAKSPPANWSLKRRLQYIEWAIQVVSKLPKTSEKAINTFYQRCD